jgi:hypothetical protein
MLGVLEDILAEEDFNLTRPVLLLKSTHALPVTPVKSSQDNISNPDSAKKTSRSSKASTFEEKEKAGTLHSLSFLFLFCKFFVIEIICFRFVCCC